MSTVYENAIEAVRETSGRLVRELPANLPAGIVPSGIEWPDDLADRVTDELVHGFDVLKSVVVPAATVAVGAGNSAAISGGRLARRHPALLVGVGLAVVGAVIWLARRRRSASDEQPVRSVESQGRPISAA